MNLLSLDEIKALSEIEGGLSVSFFMPTHRMGSETQQNQIRFKNLLKKAEEELVRNGMRSADTRDFLNRHRIFSTISPSGGTKETGFRRFFPRDTGGTSGSP